MAAAYAAGAANLPFGMLRGYIDYGRFISADHRIPVPRGTTLRVTLWRMPETSTGAVSTVVRPSIVVRGPFSSTNSTYVSVVPMFSPE